MTDEERERVIAEARAERERLVAEATAEYHRVIAPLKAQYERVSNDARAERERLIAYASAEYKRITGRDYVPEDLALGPWCFGGPVFPSRQSMTTCTDVRHAILGWQRQM